MRRLGYLPLAAIIGFAACGSAGNPQAETAGVAAAQKSAVEMITPMRDPDGQWRVSGYFMK